MQVLNGCAVSTITHLSADINALYSNIENATLKNRPVVANAFSSSAAYSSNKIVAIHSHTITGVSIDSSGQRWIELRNPWSLNEIHSSYYQTDIDRNGDENPNGNNERFRMKIEAFKQQFYTTFIGL
jgi:hypothetical protein